MVVDPGSALGHPGAAAGEHHDIAGAQLPAPAVFDRTVDAHQTVGDHRLGVGAGIDQAGELEELTEPDRGIPDRDIGGFGAGVSHTARLAVPL